MKKSLLILLLVLSAHCFAQFSKTHYIPPVSNSDAQEPQGQYMYISSPSLTPVKFKIIALGGLTVQGNVSRDNPYVYTIGSGSNTQFMVSSNNVNSVRHNKGYIVEAEDQVYVTVRLTTTPDSFQGGGLVSKGLAALGTKFRIGAFINTGISATDQNHYTFGSILATENNTTIHFSDIKPGVSLINNPSAGNNPADITLNRGDSFVIAVQGPNTANRDGLIGALVSSDKPIAFNCGSIAGTNGDANNLDLGFDQIVSAERTGKEYIFIKGNGSNVVERPLLIANEDNTAVYLNGNNMAFTTLDAGEYVALNGSQYSFSGNLYVRTSKDVFAYQGIGGTLNQANQNMCFVPPLSCETPKIIDNIPYINRIGNNTGFVGNVAVVTETNAELNFILNGVSYSYANLPVSIVKTGPLTVNGNPNYVTYTFEGLTGNISVYSTKQVYLSYFGSSEFATYGGFYSGFTFKPEIAFKSLDTTTASNCIPNIQLSVNILTAFDTFQWYFNDVAIPGATQSTYIPTTVSGGGLGPGFYHVKAGISTCGTELISDKIPVSSCANDSDNDTINDNIDIDNDNDGMANCTESYGNIPLDLSSASSTPALNIMSYSNPFTITQTGTGTQSSTPFSGTTAGNFVSETTTGIGNSVSEKISFTNPVSLLLDYVATANTSDLLSSGSEFKIQVPFDKTITILNPDNQLLIDTNYDGIFESGITQFSSFEIRFRLNNSTNLPAGTGTFELRANLVDYIIYTHSNLSDSAGNRATFRLSASCVPKDSDGDLISDQLDLDSDNDGIPDTIEALGSSYTILPFVDSDNNGLNDVHGSGLAQLDTDNDTIPDYLDLDSDNDGIYDRVESGNNASDNDNNGIVDGNLADFGTNGYLNSLETATDSNTPNFTIKDTDSDGIQDYIDKDSDNDSCNDVIEAGFSDPDSEGTLGNSPVSVNIKGIVTTATDGYTVPNNNYVTAAPIIINTQPINKTSCASETAHFVIATNSVNGYQWQFSTDGTNFSDLSDDSQYSGVTTDSLTISGITVAMNNYRYRVFLKKTGNTCGLISSSAILNVLASPNVPAISTLVQCDDDLDGLADFNLTQKESLISTNAANETFTYFTSQPAAETNNTSFQITNTNTYNNSAGNTVWVRIQNSNNCFSITRLDLVVSATHIPATTSWSFSECDDFLDVNGNNNADNNDRDGITSFDFSSVTSEINTILLNNPGYTITYYKNEADALSETDTQGNSLAITAISNYRNIDYPGQQFIWVRVDSDNDNSCYGLGPYISLNTEALPVANTVSIPRLCDKDAADTAIEADFDTSSIETTVLGTQSNVTVTYFDENNNALPSPLPNPFTTGTQLVRIRLTNNTTSSASGPCYDETTLQFTVDAIPVANTAIVSPACDEATDTTLPNDGIYGFDTTSIESAILGNQTGFVVKYYAEDGSLLPSPLPNPFNTPTQTITAVVENPINPNCNASTPISFILNPVPEILDGDSRIICTGILANETIKLSAGLAFGSKADYTYEWYRNDIVIPGATSYDFSTAEDGIYTTKITDIVTSCSIIRTNVVSYSQIPTIEGIEIKDLTDNNIVTITASGLGSYGYSIDNPDGPFQDSPIFENVTSGFHTVYVIDTNGCGKVSKNIAVIGAPLFFTPNGDSFNDTWKIKGIDSSHYRNSTVYIFDRHGKLLYQIPSASGSGWDGTFNGQPMPADDYWYLLNLEDGRIDRGHFALKR